MSYKILVAEKPFQRKSVQVRESLLGNHKLWSSTDGRFLLYHTKGYSFLNEIGLSIGDKIANWEWTQEQIIAVFRHFYASGQISRIEFGFDSDDYDDLEVFDPLNELIRKRRHRNGQADTEKAVSLFEYLVNEVMAEYPRYFKLDLGEITVNLYMNGYAHVVFPRSNSEKIVMDLYQTLFSIMNISVDWQEVSIQEKPKSSHPLQKSHAILETLFELAGEETRKRLTIDETEFEQVKQLLLKEMKPYEEKMIYL